MLCYDSNRMHQQGSMELLMFSGHCAGGIVSRSFVMVTVAIHRPQFEVFLQYDMSPRLTTSGVVPRILPVTDQPLPPFPFKLYPVQQPHTPSLLHTRAPNLEVGPLATYHSHDFVAAMVSTTTTTSAVEWCVARMHFTLAYLTDHTQPVAVLQVTHALPSTALLAP